MVLPLPTSLNALYIQEFKFNPSTKKYEPTGGRILSPEGRNCKMKIQKQVRKQMPLQNWNKDISLTKDIYLDVVIFFPKKGMDSDAVFKLLMDSLQGLCYHNDSVVLPRVQRRLIDQSNPHIEVKLTISPYIGIFDNQEHFSKFENNCKSCSRYRDGSCSILRKSIEGRIQPEITDFVCSEYKEKKGKRK